MENLLKLQRKLIPQVIELMERRYSILRQINLSEPIGRRTLANILGISERIIRSETELLKDQELIEVNISGMKLTVEGHELLEELRDIMNSIMSISNLEQILKEQLKIKNVVIVPGSYDDNESLMKDIGKYSGEYFLDIIKENYIVSITGGHTMLEFATNLKCDKKFPNLRVVPSRGGVGKNVESQANNIVGMIAKKLGCKYSLLNIPDSLSHETMKTLMSEPEIKKTLDYIKKTDVLIFGIGRADEMATRRKLPKHIVEYINSRDAVGEAFGYYFNKQGEIVFEIKTVGIDLETYNSIKENIGIVAGKRKAEAVIAMSKINRNLALILDEDTALEILELLQS